MTTADSLDARGVSLRSWLPGFDSRLGRGLLVALALWVAAWSWLGRAAMLDDALIHLRYAANLIATGEFAYNGTTRTYGDSSPLFVLILALGRAVWRHPLLPKAVSVVFYMACLGQICRLRRSASGTRWAWTGLLWICASPMAIRWLSDGMETSLVVFSVLSLVSLLERPGTGSFHGLTSALAGFACALLRIEVAIAAVLSAAVSALWRHRERRLVKEAALLAGVAGGLAAIWLFFGQILPDTAAAKSLGHASAWETAGRIWKSQLHAGSFGLGLLALWGIAAVRGFRTCSGTRLGALALSQSLALALFVAIAARNQILQGVRPLLWAFFLLTAWALVIADAAFAEQRSAPPTRSPQRWAAALAVSGLLVAWCLESPVVATIQSRRSEVLATFLRSGVGQLRGEVGLAGDIGFIGYFSEAEILDLNGLVNGPTIAALSTAQRATSLLARRPSFLYVDETWQARATTAGLEGFAACGTVGEAGPGGEQVHYLLVDTTRLPALATHCPLVGSRPR